MIMNVGEKVVYPSQGPCRIGAMVKKEFGGKPMKFYPLAVMDDSGDVLFVPVDKIESLGIRQLMGKSEIPKLLSQLSREAKAAVLPTTAMKWKQRATDNSKLLASGSAFDLAKIIGSLTELNERKALTPRDRQVLDRAKRHLICEISAVTGETKSAAEQRVDDALKNTKGIMTSSKRQDPGSDFSLAGVSIKEQMA
jgi:CarD family transcriptional regulator, regulator of rRNA transcription